MPFLPSWCGRVLPILLSSATLVVTSCNTQSESADSSKTLMHNDFEGLAGWLGSAPAPSLTTEKAHSGKYSLKVDGTTEFSMGYNNLLGLMSKARINKIKVEAWVFSPSAEAGSLLVTTVSDGVADHKPMLWDGFDVVKASDKHNEWVHVSKVIDMPAGVNYSSHLGVYLWRNKGTLPTYIDDLTITEAP